MPLLIKATSPPRGNWCLCTVTYEARSVNHMVVPLEWKAPAVLFGVGHASEPFPHTSASLTAVVDIPGRLAVAPDSPPNGRAIHPFKVRPTLLLGGSKMLPRAAGALERFRGGSADFLVLI
jgi:hypothetical protein